MVESAPALELVRLSKRYPGVQALDGVSLTLVAGEVHALAGENGAGKSSLIKVVAGVTSRDSGEMRLNGLPYAPHSPVDAMRAGIRVVHQELHMLDTLSVAENLLFERLPQRGLGFVDRRELERRAAEVLARVGLEGVSPSEPVASLGVAQRQLIEIGKALSWDSRVLVLDEPTATLTSRETERLFVIIDQLRASGVAVMFVSHHLQEMFEICQRVTVLRNGRVVTALPIGQTSPRALVRHMVGREVRDEAPRHARHAEVGTAPDALAVEKLRLTGKVHGSDGGISFSVRRGEVLGLAGLVGSGRTETVRAIFGADRRAGGRILRDGREVDIRSPRDALAAGICLVSEDRKDEGLVLDLPVRENLVLARLHSFARLGWMRRRSEESASRGMVKQLDIRLAGIEQPPRTLSGGNQQKVVLGKWLLAQPQVLILDEPTRGIDVGAKAELHALLRTMADEGLAMLVVSSDLPELLQLCDRIAVLSKGRLAGILPREQCSEDRLLEMAYSAYLQSLRNSESANA
jgi:ribose transport system ATP-binding protein